MAKKQAPETPAPLHTGKGFAGTPLEAGTGTSAILSISNDGPAKQVSLAAPFGKLPTRPAGVVPLLKPEKEMPAGTPTQFDAGWTQIKATAQVVHTEEMDTVPMDMVEEPAEVSEANPFAEEETEPEAASEGEITEQEVDVEALMSEADALRKENQALREGKGVEQAPEQALNALRIAQEQLESLRAQVAAGTGQSLALPEWKGKDLRVCFPCYKTTNPATAFVLLSLALDFGKDRIGFIPGLGDARIANTRNRLADDFLKTGATYCLMLDDDMVPTVGRPEFIRNFIGASHAEVSDKVLSTHAIDRLLKSGKKLIGATYFGRRKYSPAMFKEGIDNPAAYNKAKNMSGEILPTEWVGTGCLLVHRDVFLGIQKVCPELAPHGSYMAEAWRTVYREKSSGRFVSSEEAAYRPASEIEFVKHELAPVVIEARPFWDFFQEGEGQNGGEDKMFCRRAKKAGFQPCVDTGAICYHIGFLAFGAHNTENIKPAAPQSQASGWPGPR